jgi:hypothetical protein
MTAPIELLVRHRNGDILGVLDFFRLELTQRWRDVGAWTVETPNNEMGRLLASPGSSLVARRKIRPAQYMTLISGPMTVPSYVRDENGGARITCTGLSDLVRLWDMIATPCPAPYNTIANDIRSGAAETVIKSYVEDHATDAVRSGAAADTAVLTVLSDQGRGGLVTGNARFDILGDLVQSLAIAGGLGMSADNLGFDVYESADRSREQVFSFASGNLNSFAVTGAAPTCTFAIAGGPNEGVDRVFRTAYRNDDPSWGRNVERFFDQRSAQSVAEMDQKNQEELEKGQAIQQIAINPIDRPHREYGIDWNLGDTVLCEGIVSVVTDITLTYDESGLQIRPAVAIGGNQTELALRFFDEIRAVYRRVRALERR